MKNLNTGKIQKLYRVPQQSMEIEEAPDITERSIQINSAHTSIDLTKYVI